MDNIYVLQGILLYKYFISFKNHNYLVANLIFRHDCLFFFIRLLVSMDDGLLAFLLSLKRCAKLPLISWFGIPIYLDHVIIRSVYIFIPSSVSIIHEPGDMAVTSYSSIMILIINSGSMSVNFYCKELFFFFISTSILDQYVNVGLAIFIWINNINNVLVFFSTVGILHQFKFQKI